MEIEFVSAGPVEGEALSAIAVPVFDNETLGDAGEALDGASGGALSRAMATSRFTGELDQTLDILAPAGPRRRRGRTGRRRDRQAEARAWRRLSS